MLPSLNLDNPQQHLKTVFDLGVRLQSSQLGLLVDRSHCL